MSENTDKNTMKASEIAEILQKNFQAVVAFKANEQGLLTSQISYVSLSGKIRVYWNTHEPYQAVYFEDISSDGIVLMWANGHNKDLAIFNKLTIENKNTHPYNIIAMDDKTKKGLRNMGLL